MIKKTGVQKYMTDVTPIAGILQTPNYIAVFMFN